MDTFREQFDAAMSRLDSGIPGACVKVASIPDIHQLWELFRDNDDAASTWDSYDICPSLLENPRSDAPEDVERREAFRQRVIDYNTELESVCSGCSQCEFDGNAAFDTTFEERHVTTREYFHPGAEGQILLAEVAWQSIGYRRAPTCTMDSGHPPGTHRRYRAGGRSGGRRCISGPGTRAVRLHPPPAPPPPRRSPRPHAPPTRSAAPRAPSPATFRSFAAPARAAPGTAGNR
ncbi:hypothetical protein SAMN06265360_12622 [Haloechinothrix alba]|uniref:Uncharacterized protein n=1 Tax=Haloechinothrix alba TaxID=664784 RepID=A0A238ZV90_9PSEU|nr:hypothetical protein SAMN06265360_12622 [Haloechinothrix alba]